MELWKYSSGPHAEKAVSAGVVRIGTLYDYRKDEHGAMICDGREGIKIFSGTAVNLTERDIRGNDAFQMVVSADEGSTVQIGRLKMTDCRMERGDFYVFSAAASYDPETHQAWNNSSGYDSCYIIRSARLFFRALSEYLRETAEFVGYAHVHYYDDSHGIDINSEHVNVHPALCKPASLYSNQQEVRAIWRTLRPRPLKPIIIEAKAAARYCDLYRAI